MTIPGDAPALAEVHITHSGGAAAPVWAIVAWWERPKLENRCWNGDFSSVMDVDGWLFAAVTNITAGATSIARLIAPAKYPPGSGEIVCPATIDSGASFRIFRRFQRGVTYTAEVWIQSAAQTTATYVRLGNGSANDKATSGNTNLSTTFQRISVTWTPSADRDDAHVAINIAAATATTFRIDGVMVYEGTVAPTSANQSFGRGGYPVFGIIEGECHAGLNAANASGAFYRSGFAHSAASGWDWLTYIDPALHVPADLSAPEIGFTVFGRIELPSTAVSPTAVLSAMPISPSAGQGGFPIRHSNEFGTAGASLTKPSAGTVRRIYKLGTMSLPTDLGRWRLNIFFDGGAGITTALDYIFIVPSRSVALSPTGKPKDSSFPQVFPGTDEATVIFRPDLSATFQEKEFDQIATHGLGGSLIELPPGGVDVDWLVKLSNLVPDDPTVNSTTEQLSHSATVHFSIVPRFHLARSA